MNDNVRVPPSPSENRVSGGSGTSVGRSQRTAATARAAAAASQANHSRRRCRERPVTAGYPWPEPSKCCVSVSSSRASPIHCSRFLGSLSRQRASSLRTGGGVSGGSASRSGGSLSTEARTSDTVSPSKSLRPVSISHSTTPKAQMSARRSTFLPRACSGDM